VVVIDMNKLLCCYNIMKCSVLFTNLLEPPYTFAHARFCSPLLFPTKPAHVHPPTAWVIENNLEVQFLIELNGASVSRLDLEVHILAP